MSKQKTNSKTKSGMLLILITLFIALVGYVLFSGVSVGVYDIGNVSNNINYGLDLTGGVNVVLEAEATDDDPVTAEKIESAMLTIRQRIDTLGVSEPTITKQGDNRIRVSIPSVSDQEEALDLIGKTAQLEFVG
ncbi:MAG: protein translocase subunit SecD, partial [Firmicutes bacterium HGW-Firmicutes-6]